MQEIDEKIQSGGITIILTTYDTLKQYTDAFASGKISLLVLKGRGAIGKTYMIEQSTLQADCVNFNGHATPLSIYLKLYENPTQLVVFDDVDSLITNKITVALLKQVCEMKPDKIIRYNSTHKVEDKQIPSSFNSNNRVCLTCNDFKRVGKNIAALLTRAIFIDFQPSNLEVLLQIAKFDDLDKEIFSYLEDHAHQIKELNFRTYIKCVELKQANLDWKDYLTREYKIDPLDEYSLTLLAYPVNIGNWMWQERTGKSTRSLQRRLKKLEVFNWFM